ncbi:MAG: isoleucine--tRNA ligase [Acholeplasmataceae bacterium]
MDYKDTLNLPKTEFPMRGNLGVKEPEMQAQWEKLNLYERVLENRKDAMSFVLHDGPPYANGDIHIGHALNKILKDFVLRYKTMAGFKVRYIPGWDTHGLPIETALAKKGIKRKDMPLYEYRKLCMDYALEQVEKQKVQFKRLGILGEWDQPYITLQNSYEAAQIEIFAKMVEKGLIYKGLKPVFWSPSSESALAEAEIEYKDVEDTSIYVALKAIDTKQLTYSNLYFVIWTTTPWTIPANKAVSVHPDLNYAVINVGDAHYVVAETLVNNVVEKAQWEDYEVVTVIKGQSLEYMTYAHPVFDETCPVICGDHVTAEDGSGLVHTAPGHGEDDYMIGNKYQLEVFCPVDEKGFMTEDAQQFKGLFYKDANEEVIQSLDNQGLLLNQTKFTHSYPHDWRTSKPVIFRATPQWFASVKSIKKDLLEAVKDVQWYPNWGELRLSNMIENREDWCISRQRAWGVPIPVFYAENGDPILDQAILSHVAKLFEAHGSNVWFEREAKELMPKGYSHPGSPNGIFKKETDIMDVWFDSGTSYSVLNNRDEAFPADLYLEGSDQYRGWFNSSLSTSVAAFGKAPYKTVVSHGFVLDGQGRKMSKSLGNTVDPIKVMHVLGADILRLWVATSDYQSDLRISDDNLKQISEGYRKIRNTIRYILGVISDFDVTDHYVSFSMRGNMNRAMTLRMDDIINEVIDSYDMYEFDKVYRVIMPFIINDLSAFYLDFTKDILYLENKNDFERRAIQSTLYDILYSLLILITPLMPHTASESYQYVPNTRFEDIYLEDMPKKRLRETFLKYLSYLEDVKKVRDVVNSQMEIARNEKVINKSMQASVSLNIPKEMLDHIQDMQFSLKQILMVAEVTVDISETLSASLKPFEGHTCERCWNVFESLEDGHVCDRCHRVLKESL